MSPMHAHTKEIVMANVDVLSGTYHIPALSTNTFTFWWPSPQPNGKEYFDVSIAPHYYKQHNVMKPLLEVKREWLYVVEVGTIHPVQWRLDMTLRNDNDFQVTFLANHIRAY